MLYQLALYALGRVSGERVSAILYPTIDAAAREQVIVIQEPVHGRPQATVALRPVNLFKLDSCSALVSRHSRNGWNLRSSLFLVSPQN
jgi:hypothetical protein